MHAVTCPSPDLLADYALGRISEATLEQVAAHVDKCAECQTRLQSLEGLNDSLVSKLRQPPPPNLTAEDSELGALVARAEAIRLNVGGVVSNAAPSRATMGVALSGTRLPTILGQYELLQRLGRGGMGTVYKARHLRLKRIVAVKVISRRRLSDPQAVTRFQHEMEAVGRLSHANIVQATDAGEAAGQHFLAMEYVDGCDLAQLVRFGGPLPIADACEIVRQAAVGLQHAHGHGLVHRDVKPSNLMLTRDGMVKLLDLGLARLLDVTGDEVEATGTAQILGSPDFMSPEQAQDARKVDTRTDLYSLGCTLYFLLAGRPPFAAPQHDTRLKKIMAHAGEQPTPIQSLRLDLPVSLVTLLTRLLAKNRDGRPCSAAEVADALAQLSVGNDLAGLLCARPVPESDDDSSLDAGLFDVALSVASACPPVSATSFFRRAWPVLVGVAILATVLAWTYWPPRPGTGTSEATANHEQGPSPIPSPNPATGTIVPVPSVPAMGRLFFEGDPEGVLLRISGGPNEPTIVDMDKQRSIYLPRGDYRIEIERETKPHTILQPQVTLEDGESENVFIGAALPTAQMESWKKTHADFRKLMEQIEEGNRQMKEENRRDDRAGKN